MLTETPYSFLIVNYMNLKLFKYILFASTFYLDVNCSAQYLDYYKDKLVLDEGRFLILSPERDVINPFDLAYPDDDFSVLNQFGDPLEVKHEKSFIMESWDFIYEDLSIGYVNMNGYKELSYIEIRSDFGLITSNNKAQQRSNIKPLKAGDDVTEHIPNTEGHISPDSGQLIIHMFHLDENHQRVKDQNGDYRLNSAVKVKIELDEIGRIKKMKYMRANI